MKYSIIVPVYERRAEVAGLLERLSTQSWKDCDVVIVEDGAKIPCKDVCDKYAGILDLHYYFKDNSGPGPSRNYGVERAQGEYVIILDSDVVLPVGYMAAVDSSLSTQTSDIRHQTSSPDAFGGPDAAHESFTDVQKAISYAMTSFFTTGGIRGGKKQLDKFYPRSFNLGIRREAYLKLGGFSQTRFSKMSLYGEDIDFSLRIFRAGYTCRLFPDAWVWHKRRTDFKKFWRQVYNSGYARVHLWRMYPEALKPVHALPSVFTLGCLSLLLLAPFTCGLSLALLLLYALLILIDSSIQSKSLKVGFLAVAAVFVQLIGYGIGFLESLFSGKLR